MTARRINLLIALLVTLIGILSLLLYFFPQVVSTLDKLQVAKLLREQREKTNSKLDIGELSFDNPPTTLFKIHGYFTKDLYYAGDYIRGDFIINGDPNKIPIVVYLTRKDGSIQYSSGPDKDTRSVSWTLTLTEDVKKSIKANKQIELRITLQNGDKSDSEQIKSTLRNMIATGTFDPQKTVFTPDMIGMLE